MKTLLKLKTPSQELEDPEVKELSKTLTGFYSNKKNSPGKKSSGSSSSVHEEDEKEELSQEGDSPQTRSELEPSFSNSTSAVSHSPPEAPVTGGKERQPKQIVTRSVAAHNPLHASVENSPELDNSKLEEEKVELDEEEISNSIAEECPTPIGAV